jgi:predicted NUDIX family NTP pyrophosphohydrolase
MAAARSAGILLYRLVAGGPEVLLVHPGGPLWVKRDAGAWSIPKGVIEDGEDPLACALREFEEELGSKLPGDRPPLELGTIRQKGGKVVEAWGVEGDLDPATVRSATFQMEWPPRSGELREFPEVDRAAWFDPGEARAKLIPAQAELLDRLLRQLAGGQSLQSNAAADA